MKLKFLGTGTSTGVPQIGCGCAVCQSEDVHDKRLRASVLVSVGETNILIDCGPDFREQMLRNGSPKLEALLITHSHYDHVSGIDDLRPYCTIGDGFPIYCKSDVATDLKERVPYCFAEHPYPGVPALNINEISTKPFKIGDIEIIPLPVMHYKLPIVGYKIGNLAYITDAKVVPDSTIEILRGVDTLVINALRTKEHISHMTLAQALDVVNAIKPRITYLTHLSHDMGLHNEVSRRLPENVKIAYDDLSIFIPY
ncbi:MAG: MBL fold metallo-hydrolase [Muribaculaceae bacterium]|nr:MBL fold metallo-hydrolase [Muribaculaceae bacterium]